MGDKKNIVFVSVSSDMYGASKVLLSLVLSLKNQSEEYNPIVCLPFEEGPLKKILLQSEVEIIEMPILLLTRSMLKTFAFINFFKKYKKAKKIFNKAIGTRKIEYIQSNTLATLFGAVYCFFNKQKHILHVHEIVEHPAIARKFFITVMSLFADKIVYNSKATQDFFESKKPSLKTKSTTIFNGVDREVKVLTSTERTNLRNKFFAAHDSELLIGLIGRINRWKGHHTLLEAFTQLTAKYPQLKLCFVGDTAPNQEYFKEFLNEKINESGVENRIQVVGFQNDIYKIIDCLDIVTVPSTEPEPFGIIILEALLSKKAVVASNTGGIPNIITHNETGILVEPNNPKKLAEALDKIIKDETLKKRIENNGYKKAITEFSVDAMYKSFHNLYKSF